MKTTVIILAYALLLIGGLTALAIFSPETKKDVQSENFVGIDAAGFKHYPDGHIERMEIKVK